MKKKICVAYITNYLNTGGPSRVIFELITNLDTKLYLPILITLFSPNDNEIIKELKRKGIAVIVLDYENRYTFLILQLLGSYIKKKEIYQRLVYMC